MIDAAQLRIGNWVKFGDIEEEINGTWNGAVKFAVMSIWTPADRIDPIPLSPEVLIACGFEYIKETRAFADKGHYVTEAVEGFDFWPDCGEKQYQVKSLHQLQNLFYALCGTEINYKPSI